mmetsp:Transcript_68363/g.198133  ORF Transcript_68363/g.198133 Transcript_68363/m.198133 type:complete len:187 (-) Transcript_68363:206-766(-)
MDSYSISKRNADPILRLGMELGTSAKLQSMHDRHAEMLRSQKAATKELHGRLREDISSQTSNMRALEKHKFDSKGMFTDMQSRHQLPSSEQHRAVASTVQALQRASTDIAGLHAEREKFVKTTRDLQPQGGPAAGSMQAWFARYGEPKRQSDALDFQRSFVMKPRWCPHTRSFSNAQVLRRGHIIK